MSASQEVSGWFFKHFSSVIRTRSHFIFSVLAHIQKTNNYNVILIKLLFWNNTLNPQVYIFISCIVWVCLSFPDACHQLVWQSLFLAIVFVNINLSGSLSVCSSPSLSLLARYSANPEKEMFPHSTHLSLSVQLRSSSSSPPPSSCAPQVCLHVLVYGSLHDRPLEEQRLLPYSPTETLKRSVVSKGKLGLGSPQKFWNSWYIFIPTCEYYISFFLFFHRKV